MAVRTHERSRRETPNLVTAEKPHPLERKDAEVPGVALIGEDDDDHFEIDEHLAQGIIVDVA